MKRTIALILIGATLAGCNVARQAQVNEARTSLVGRTKAEIMACAGVPEQAARVGEQEIMTYSAVGGTRGFASGNMVGNTALISTRSRTATCTTIFVMEKDRVAAVNYRAAGGGLLAPQASCSDVVAACMSY